LMLDDLREHHGACQRPARRTSAALRTRALEN
jgi:hypothetical protein